MSKKHNSRVWLNPPSSYDTGAMHCTLSAELAPSKDKYDWSNVDVNVAIWDCSRKIDLNLGFSKPKEFTQRLNKIQKMIDELERLKTAMVEANAELVEHSKNRKKHEQD